MDDWLRKGGDQAFQIPHILVGAPTLLPVNNIAKRVFSWILWDAARKGAWPRNEDPAGRIRFRHAAACMRAGAGLDRAKDYRAIRASLHKLELEQFIFPVEGGGTFLVPMLRDVEWLPGHHVEYDLSEELVALHRQPLGRYALLNLDHIREMKRPLDHLIYEHACLVARMRQPQFTLHLWQIARAVDVASGSWSAVRRQFLGACQRVAAITCVQFHIVARCTGDAPCIDTFRILPQRLGAPPPSKRELRSLLFHVDAGGASRLP